MYTTRTILTRLWPRPGTHSRQLETSSHSLALHRVPTTDLTPSILVAHLRLTHKAKFKTTHISLDSPNTPQPKHLHTYENNIIPPSLFGIYKELDKHECHFSDLQTGHTSNLNLDNPHTDLDQPTNLQPTTITSRMVLFHYLQKKRDMLQPL